MLPNWSSQQSDIRGGQVNNLKKSVERMESPEAKIAEMKVEVV